MIHTLNSCNLKQVFVKEFSRVTAYSSSLIDNVFTNVDVTSLTKETTNIHLSDHMAQILIFCSQKTAAPAKIIKKVRKIDSNGIALFRESLNSRLCLSSSDIVDAEESFSNFHDTFVELFNCCFPETKTTVTDNKKNVKHQYSEEVIGLRGALEAWATVAKISKNPNDYEKYRELKKEYLYKTSEAIRKSNAAYIENSNDTIKAIWKIINKETNTTCTTKHEEVSTLSADELNRYFCEIGEKIVNGIQSTHSSYELLLNNRLNNTHSFLFTPITAEEITTIIKKLKSKNSKDIYGISTKFLKQVHKEIDLPLAIIFNKCVEQGVFPSQLKQSKVVPIFKKGEKNECQNYRPISILPAISKIFEQAIASRLTKYLEKNKYLSSKQHGYKKGHSTSSGIYSMLKLINEGFDEGESSEMHLLDLTKAFDSVCHDLLLRKLEYYGVRGRQHNLLKSYLSNRTQLTVWNASSSNLEKVQYGVPQGSILGPLLFIIYINDLPVNMRGIDVCLYADDTSLLVRAKDRTDLQGKSEKAVTDASVWFAANKLNVNHEKTQKIIFATKIAIPTTVKFLGMVMDSCLKWQGHVDYMAGKLSSALYAIKRLKYIATHSAARLAYFSYFHAHLCYGVLFWGAKAEAHRLFVLQKQAVRFICNLEYGQSCKGYFRKEGILTLPSIYILASISYVHTNKREFPQNGHCHNYPTRGRTDMRVPYHRLACTQTGVDYWGAKFYNELPESMKVLPLRCFKKQAKVMLMNMECYSIEEFLNT